MQEHQFTDAIDMIPIAAANGHAPLAAKAKRFEARQCTECQTVQVALTLQRGKKLAHRDDPLGLAVEVLHG